MDEQIENEISAYPPIKIHKNQYMAQMINESLPSSNVDRNFPPHVPHIGLNTIERIDAPFRLSGYAKL